MAKKKKQEGVIVYYETLDALQPLSMEERGRLFTAILEYSKLGVIPDFDDSQALKIAWAYQRPKIERDRLTYEKKCRKNQYESLKHHHPSDIGSLSFEEWEEIHFPPEDQVISSDIERYPTTSASPSASPTTYAFPTTPASAIAEAAASTAGVQRGNYREEMRRMIDEYQPGRG